MTAPRQILPGQVYLVTRRCSQRQFLLKPSKLTNATFGYLLAVAAARHRVRIHAYAVLSNHYHLVLSDPEARLPLFGQLLDSLVARALNASYERWEHFWAPSSYSAVTLVSRDDVVEKAAYTLANPVAAGLVEHGADWPGLWSDPALVGGDELAFPRPQHFFDANGSMPEVARLRLVPPAGFTAEAFRSRLHARLAELEQAAALELQAEGRKFMGVRRVLAQKHTDRPGTAEPRRELNPRVAAGDRWRRIEALGRLKSFLHDHRTALESFRRGVARVVFPEGTYRMRVLFGVACAQAG